MGPIEQRIAMQAYRAGDKLPDRIANAPQLKRGLELYLQAFFDLDAERSHSMGLTRIPWRSMWAYAQAYGFDDEQREDLFFLLRRMDNAHIDRLKDNE